MKINNKTISPCMIGTWAWGTGSNGSKMIFGENNNEDQLKETFEKAYELGFNIWDTAEVYGMGTSEKLLGKLIKEKQVIISTKHMPNRKYKTGENKTAIEKSLERLEIEYIDLYWLHSPKNIEQNMKELAQCQKLGLIKNIGLSNCSIEQIKQANRKWWEYWKDYWRVRNTKEAYEKDYACFWHSSGGNQDLPAGA